MAKIVSILQRKGIKTRAQLGKETKIYIRLRNILVMYQLSSKPVIILAKLTE